MKTIRLPRVLNWLRIMLLGLFGIVVFQPVFPWLDPLLSICIRLAIGWIVFLANTAPKVQMNSLLVFNGLLAVALGTWILHWLLKFVNRHLRQSPGQWRWKWTLAGPVMLGMLFGICVTAAGIVAQTIELFQEPIRHLSILEPEARDKRNAQILSALARASDPDLLEKANAGKWSEMFRSFPENTEDLARRAIVLTAVDLDVPEVWTCLGELDESADGNIPIICAPRAFSKRGRLVVFADGRPRFCNPQEYEEAIARWHAAKAMLSGHSKQDPNKGGGAP